MRKIVKIICIVLCVAALVAAGLYYIPLKTTIDQDMYGVIITEDGTVVTETNVEISGSIKEYLFKSNCLNMDVALEGAEIAGNQTVNLTKSWKDLGARPFYYGYYDIYSAALNRFVTGFFGLSFARDWVVLTFPEETGKYFVASTNPDFDTQEILKAFHEVCYN